MAIVKSKPTSPGSRFVVRVNNSELSKSGPYAPLLSKRVNPVAEITTDESQQGTVVEGISNITESSTLREINLMYQAK